MQKKEEWIKLQSEIWKVDDEVLLNQKTRMSIGRALSNLLVRDIVKSSPNPGSHEMNYKNEYPICASVGILWNSRETGARA